MIRLSKRLQLFHDLLLPNEPVWDLCCDHGLLGFRALESGFPEVHFVDQVPHVIEKIRVTLVDLPDEFQEKAFAYAQPAENLEKILCGSVVIAGVGGTRILGILRELHARDCLQARRLILSPHKDERDFEAGFHEIFQQGEWRLGDFQEVTESSRQRPVWTADR